MSRRNDEIFLLLQFEVRSDEVSFAHVCGLGDVLRELAEQACRFAFCAVAGTLHYPIDGPFDFVVFGVW